MKKEVGQDGYQSHGEPVNVAVVSGNGVGPEVISSVLAIADVAMRRCGRPPLNRKNVSAGRTGAVKNRRDIEQAGKERADKSAAIFTGPFGRNGGANKARLGGIGLAEGDQMSARIWPIRAYCKDAALTHVDFVIVSITEPADDDSATEALASLVRSLAEKRRAAGKPSTISIIGELSALQHHLVDRTEGQTVETRDVADVENDFRERPGSLGILLANASAGRQIVDAALTLTGQCCMAPAVAAIGKDHGVLEPLRGSWPDLAERNKANPLGATLSAAMMLDYLSKLFGDDAYSSASDLIERAIDMSFVPEKMTSSAFYKMGTRAVTERLIASLLEMEPA